MQDEWLIDVKSFGKIRFSQSFLNQINEYRQLDLTTPESGGVILGSFLNSGGKLLIHDYTPPQKTDKQGRCLYHRSKEHNELVQKVWVESNNHTTYVGLWHTHPENIPNFSSVDKQDWINSLKNSRYDGSSLLFIIVGRTHIKCWLGSKKVFRSDIRLIGEYQIDG